MQLWRACWPLSSDRAPLNQLLASQDGRRGFSLDSQRNRGFPSTPDSRLGIAALGRGFAPLLGGGRRNASDRGRPVRATLNDARCLTNAKRQEIDRQSSSGPAGGRERSLGPWGRGSGEEGRPHPAFGEETGRVRGMAGSLGSGKSAGGRSGGRPEPHAGEHRPLVSGPPGPGGIVRPGPAVQVQAPGSSSARLHRQGCGGIET